MLNILPLVVTLFLIRTANAVELRNIEPALVIPSSTSAAAIPDRRFIFGRNGGRVLVWNALTGALIADVPGEGGAVDPHTGMAVLGTQVWDLNAKERVIDTGLKERDAPAAGISSDARFAVIGGRTLQVWDLAEKHLVGSIKSSDSRPTFLALTDQADYLAVGHDAQFEVFETRHGKSVSSGALAAVWPFRKKPSKGFSAFVGAHSAEFSVIYEKTKHGRETRHRPLWRIDWETDSVNVFGDFMPDTGLRARSHGKTAELSWAVEGSSRAVLVGHGAPVERIAFSPDRWTVATGDKNGDVRIWDAHDGTPLYRCHGTSGPIVSLAFSPDAQFLLAASPSEIRVYAISP